MKIVIAALLATALTLPAAAPAAAPNGKPAPARAAAAPASAAALPDADPALWVVRDADTTIYMFGTIHILDGKSEWFNDEVKAAFDRSQEVVVEAVVPEDPAAMQPLIVKYGVDASGKTLRSKMPTAMAATYERALKDLSVPAQALDMFEPWMANFSLVALSAQKLGMKPDHGADMVIKRAARSAGKPISELEGVEWQFSLFDKMPEAQQLRHLQLTLDQMPKADAMLRSMLQAWKKGDEDSLAKDMNVGLKDAPDLRKVLLADRNAAWAKWIDDRLDRPGTVFMAVGAGHLTGGDSVQAFLSRKGIKSERLTY